MTLMTVIRSDGWASENNWVTVCPAISFPTAVFYLFDASKEERVRTGVPLRYGRYLGVWWEVGTILPGV